MIIHDEAYLPEAEALSHFASSITSQIKLVNFSELLDLNHHLTGIFGMADAAVGLTDYSLLTTSAVVKAVANGMRYLSIPPVTLDGRSIFAYDFIQEDLVWARALGQQILDIAKKTDHVHVTTAAGTDLTFRYRNRKSGVMSGTTDHAGAVGSASFEFYIPIEEDQTTGTLILDGAMGQLGYLSEPLKLTYQDGKITSIGNGPEGERMRAYINSFDDQRTLHASEFGIGLNRLAHCLGRCYIEDESALSTCHIGHGRNLTLGGVLDAEGHYDLVMLKPTISFGSRTVMVDGKLTL